jgi:uncharacterized membrane protein
VLTLGVSLYVIRCVFTCLGHALRMAWALAMSSSFTGPEPIRLMGQSLVYLFIGPVPGVLVVLGRSLIVYNTV